MIVLVTGARTGIGRGISEHLARAGHTVLGCSRRVPASLPEGYRHYQADVTDNSSLKAMFQTIRKDYGHIDALVNNAGTAAMVPFMLTSDSVARGIFDLNVFATMACCRGAIKLMRRSAAPSIVNISSVAVRYSLEGQLAYAASKAAIEQMTRTLSREVAAMRIRVNTLGLPPVRTALTRSVHRAKIEALIERQAIKRECAMDDIVGPVDFLLSDSARFVTGETLYLGGVH
ncbi:MULTISPECIES: SDR family NAD(P)-dependent oxidoreductase [Rhizobium]|uniref:Short-chain dehydrogenase/reductase SDR n=1 Tax=Rhizobium favelukesii TaxID=348824 RepID=W6RFJ5_9HYPH|nr:MULTISPECIES: SDR family oxidoreductase [Rhizobium]MCA0806505.1 SDR family oxidoreductase [Rhizobium sp. T1473]MCS0463461.1 SDR family oxidoreductase [Rhizobium favelukesii]UFS85077.1 SDR family oxidoreductase [Rhizobium sp. T136]CDM60017.1 short-chain dehydrogenase/reductase SDR [Rhizobium favelukesii]